MSLEQTLKFIETKESGKRSASRLHENQTIDSAKSSYMHRKSESIKEKSDPNQNCLYCGRKGHGKTASFQVRKNLCPAFNKPCNKCKRLNHFETVCRSKLNLSEQPNENTKNSKQNAIQENDILCSLQSPYQSKTSSIALDHHLYDQLTNTWIKRPSKPQPFININVSLSSEDNESFGHKLNTESQKILVSAMADTGCQSCLAGINVMKRLGLGKNDLIPVSMKMHAANNKGIAILGALFLKFTGTSKQGKKDDY